MKQTLYQKIKESEKLNDRLKVDVKKFQESLESFKNLPGYSRISLGEIPEINVFAVQKNLIEEYKNNPVLRDAIQGKISIEDSLSELAQVNRPIWRLFPRRKNKAHNERLDQIGELLGYPYHLKTRGIFIPDNFIGGIAMCATVGYGISNILFYLSEGLAPNADYIQIAGEITSLNNMRTAFPALFTLVLGPILGGMMQGDRSGNLPIDEAKYLDGKVKEVYK